MPAGISTLLHGKQFLAFVFLGYYQCQHVHAVVETITFHTRQACRKLAKYCLSLPGKTGHRHVGECLHWDQWLELSALEIPLLSRHSKIPVARLLCQPV
jgi:hypothetical protein